MRCNDVRKDRVFLVLFVQKESSFHFETSGVEEHQIANRVEATKATQKIAGCGPLMARK
jgi:predicted dienelactone hydrolase